jgi:hypothetical protein
MGSTKYLKTGGSDNIQPHNSLFVNLSGQITAKLSALAKVGSPSRSADGELAGSGKSCPLPSLFMRP